MPRKSHVSLILLNSIDYALETTHDEGLHDWAFITKRHTYLLFDLLAQAGLDADDWRMREEIRVYRRCYQWFDSFQSGYSASNTSDTSDQSTVDSQAARSATDYRHAQAVYLLHGFVEAHEYAQRKIPFYLGETEGIDTPEEALVVRESQHLVAQAHKLLDLIRREILTMQLSKQAARWILHMQEDQISEFRDEGILTGKHAEEMLEDVQHDFRTLQNHAHWRGSRTSRWWLPGLWEKVLHWLASVVALMILWCWIGWSGYPCCRCIAGACQDPQQERRQRNQSQKALEGGGGGCEQSLYSKVEDV